MQTLIQVCGGCLFNHSLDIDLTDVRMIRILLKQLCQILHTRKSQFGSLRLQLLKHWVLFLFLRLLFPLWKLRHVKIGFPDWLLIKFGTELVVIATNWDLIQRFVRFWQRCILVECFGTFFRSKIVLIARELLIVC